MKVYNSQEIKNIALLGSKGAGKTTLAEAMLYECGVIKRRGSVEAGNTVTDYFPVEKEYGYSVFPTVFYAEFLNKKLNVIDCPGADDFVGGAITALSVTDTGVIVIDSQYGVEVGTQNIFRTAERMEKPVIFAMNQLDGEKADYENSLEQLREHFGNRVVQVQYPLSCGPTFNSMIDVLLMKKYSWGPDGGVPTISEIPEEEMPKARELNQKLVEAAAENDETLMEKFFDQGSLTEDEMREGIRKGLVTRSIFPVFCVSALRDMGVRRMMEFLGNVVPFVNDMPNPVTTDGVEVAPSSDGPASIFVFKTSVEPHIGEVYYFKVMSGVLKEGDDLQNMNRGSRERMAQIFCVCGQLRTKVEQPVAGDIGASVKLKDVRTGNTLNEKGITTACFWGGQWVLWGPHTAAYTYNGNMDARGIFDSNIRMLEYITNSFQLDHGTEIDAPMTPQDKDTILNFEKQKLDTLLGIGALIGTPTVEFLETENPTSNMMNGDFVWDITATPTPPFKSGTVRVCYTDEGFQSFFESE